MIDLHLDGVLEFYQTILFFEFEACFELVSCPIQIGDLCQTKHVQLNQL